MQNVEFAELCLDGIQHKLFKLLYFSNIYGKMSEDY